MEETQQLDILRSHYDAIAYFNKKVEGEIQNQIIL